MKAKSRKPGQIIEEFDVTDKEGKVHHVVFRYPRMSDVDDLLRYINSLVDERAYIARQKKVSRKEEVSWLKKRIRSLKKGNSVHVCMEVDGRVVGSASIDRKTLDAKRHVGKFAIGVAREYRSLGLGKRVFNVMAREAKKSGIRLVQSSYYEWNKPSEKLHKSLGFRVAGRIPKAVGYYGKYGDEIIVYKELKR